ncbi:hypothetical protein LEP1GSC077_0395 [Leptospira interrogans str. C10069]|nr:hypothetical protein LEP1GSC077_0395 [Leptospira interrogans str. C10069]EMN64301.1 hypothetical protein LEP1GSC092_0467 [Leptospira interrogans serovar Pyrogenes str. R168]
MDFQVSKYFKVQEEEKANVFLTKYFGTINVQSLNLFPK